MPRPRPASSASPARSPTRWRATASRSTPSARARSTPSSSAHIPEAWRRRKLGEVPLGRPGTVDEITPAALLLAADDGAYYVGASINPNGGDIMV